MKRLLQILDFPHALHETARLFAAALGRPQPHPTMPIIITNDGYLDPP